MAFKYRGGDRSTEDVSRRARQSGGLYDSYLDPDVSFFKPREGENCIRIMPATWDDKDKWGVGWEIQVYLHRNVGPDNGTYLCLDKMKGEKCPVCEARREAADEDEADALKPQWRALCWVIDRNNEKAGPQVMSMPITLFREINSRSTDKKTKELILLDGDAEGYGYDVMFTRIGTQKKTKYEGLEIDREESPLHESEKTQQKWLDYIEDYSLPEILVYYDYAHIEKVLFGKAERRRKGGEGGEEEEDTGGSRRRRRGGEAEPEVGSRRRGREEPSEEEEEVEERAPRRRREPVEDPEENAPRRRRGAAAAEEPAEEEEVEERTPRRRTRAEPDEPEEPEPEETARRADRSARRGRAEPEEERSTGKVTRRRAAAPAEEDGGEDDPSTQARKRLGRLRNRAG